MQGGALVYRSIDFQIAGVAIKTAPGEVSGWYLKNRGAAERFVKLYNKASAASSSDTPVLTISLAAGQSDCVSFNPLAFPLGISVRACTGVADSDNTAPTTNDVVGGIFYR